MLTSTSYSSEYNFDNIGVLKNIEDVLRPYAKKLVFSAHILSWIGQEDDIIADAVQETILRVWYRIRLAESGKARRVDSPERMAIVILRNHIRDLMRHDRRLIRVFSDDQWRELLSIRTLGLSEKPVEDTDYVSIETIEDIVTEDMMEEELLYKAAVVIASFKGKQMRAVLTNLANLMDTFDELTPLQKAFTKVGIQLENYREPVPEDKQMRARQASLLSIALKRLRQEVAQEIT